MKCLSPVILMQCPVFTLASSQKASTELAAATYLFNCKQSILKITPSWYVEMTQLISVKARMSICFNGQLMKAL